MDSIEEDEDNEFNALPPVLSREANKCANIHHSEE